MEILLAVLGNVAYAILWVVAQIFKVFMAWIAFEFARDIFKSIKW